MLKLAKRAYRESAPLVELIRDQGARNALVAYHDIRRKSIGVRFEREGQLQIAREGYIDLTISRIIASADLEKLAAVVGPEDKTVLDIGAHSGLFSTLVKRRHPDARVVAVEANPDLHSIIKANLSPYRNWDLVGKAVSDEVGSSTFYRNRDATQTSALSAKSAAVFGGGPQAADGFTVETTTIDALADDLGVDRFDVVKLDIQGAESQAIKGASHMLASIRKLIIEVTFLEERPEDMLLALREEFGDPVMLQPVMSGADLLYTRA